MKKIVDKKHKLYYNIFVVKFDTKESLLG